MHAARPQPPPRAGGGAGSPPCRGLGGEGGGGGGWGGAGGRGGRVAAPRRRWAAGGRTDPLRAEGVCRWVPPGVRTCAPFEEEILPSWTGGGGGLLLTVPPTSPARPPHPPAPPTYGNEEERLYQRGNMRPTAEALGATGCPLGAH